MFAVLSGRVFFFPRYSLSIKLVKRSELTNLLKVEFSRVKGEKFGKLKTRLLKKERKLENGS